MAYQPDIDPKNKEELRQRDRNLRDAMAQVSKQQRDDWVNMMHESTQLSKGHLRRCIDPRPKDQQPNFRTLFSYGGKSVLPPGVPLPEGASQKDAAFNLKVRLAEVTTRAVSEGNVTQRVSEGIKNGEATRVMGNVVTGVNEQRLSKYMLNDNLFKSGSLEPKLYIQPGGTIYLQFWHDSPQSSGSEPEEREDDIDLASGWY